MKILLLYTVYKENLLRINNLIASLNLQKDQIKNYNFEPIFVVGTPHENLDFKGYRYIKLDIEDSLVNHPYKLFKVFEILENEEFDFICKPDHDTLITFKNFDKSILKGYDYVGSLCENDDDVNVSVNINKIKKDINLFPTFFKEKFNFMAGNCYFLSKKALKYIITQKKFLEDCKKYFVFEDRLFGYLLKDKDIKLNNISHIDNFTIENALQVTKNFFSIHPVSNNIFLELTSQPIKTQKEILEKNKLFNLGRRLSYFKKLEINIRKVLIDFYNEKRSIGING